MKKCLYSVTMILSAMLLAGLFSCTKEDDIYSYKGYISEDSLEVISENVELATQVAGEAFLKCKSIEDVKKYIDDIKKCESVEDVRVDNHGMYVMVKGFGTIPYYFKHEVDYRPDSLLKLLEHKVRTRSNGNYIIHNQLKIKNACVVNQAIYDEDLRCQDARQMEALIKRLFSECGYGEQRDVKPTVEFFQNKIYDYDMVFIITHGGYYPEDGLLWIATSEECVDRTDQDRKNGITRAWVQKEYGKLYKLFSDKLVNVSSHPEIRNGKENVYYYLEVSEKLISTSDGRFGEGRTPIIFNGACFSMKNDGFADAFIGKGAKAYFGYDEENTYGHLAGYYFFANLTLGKSITAAYNAIPKDYRIQQEDGQIAQLLPKYATDQDYTYSCIEHPTLTDVIGISESGGDYIKLRACMRNCGFSDVPEPTYGFSISESDNPLDAFEAYEVKMEKDEGCYYDDITAYYEKKILTKDLKPQTTYYCWAFMSDRESLCFSNMGTFTTPEMTIAQVIPEDIRKEIEPYIPLYEGKNPPNINGTYLIEPTELVYDSGDSYKPGFDKFFPFYIKFSNQNPNNNTLDCQQKEFYEGKRYGESEGKGVYISGEGNNFTVYFDSTGESFFDEYSVVTKQADIISGKKTDDGIKDIRHVLIVLEKGSDPKNKVMKVGKFRVFKDGDEMAKNATWPSSTREQQITVDDEEIITPWIHANSAK